MNNKDLIWFPFVEDGSSELNFIYCLFHFSSFSKNAVAGKMENHCDHFYVVYKYKEHRVICLQADMIRKELSVCSAAWYMILHSTLMKEKEIFNPDCNFVWPWCSTDLHINNDELSWVHRFLSATCYEQMSVFMLYFVGILSYHYMNEMELWDKY